MTKFGESAGRFALAMAIAALATMSPGCGAPGEGQRGKNTVSAASSPASRPAGPIVAIVKGQDPDAMIARAIQLSGGLKGLVKDGQTVVIKPNLTWLRDDKYYPGMTTDVRVVAALVKEIRKVADCKIIIAESCGKPIDLTFRETGYAKLAQDANIQLVDLGRDKRVSVKLDDPCALKEYQIPKTVMDCDVLIDVAVLKTHMEAGITLGIKNLFAYQPMPRMVFHPILNEVLADTVRCRKPDLVIIDGLVGMEGQGPIEGTSIKMDLVLAGRDVVAVDTVGAMVMGADPKAVRYLQLAAAKGVGEGDISKITVVGEQIAKVRKVFKPACTEASVRLPKDDEIVKKLMSLAAETHIITGDDNDVTVATFPPNALHPDTAKYPRRQSYGFNAMIHDRGVEVNVLYEALIPETRPAAVEEVQAWIKDNLGVQGQVRPERKVSDAIKLQMAK